MKLRELLEHPTRARVCIRGRLPPLSLPLPASSSCIRATSIRIWCARGEVRRLRKFCAYRDTVFARRPSWNARSSLFLLASHRSFAINHRRTLDRFLAATESSHGGEERRCSSFSSPFHRPISNRFVPKNLHRWTILHPLVSKSLEISIFASLTPRGRNLELSRN